MDKLDIRNNALDLIEYTMEMRDEDIIIDSDKMPTSDDCRYYFYEFFQYVVFTTEQESAIMQSVWQELNTRKENDNNFNLEDCVEDVLSSVGGLDSLSEEGFWEIVHGVLDSKGLTRRHANTLYNVSERHIMSAIGNAVKEIRIHKRRD